MENKIWVQIVISGFSMKHQELTKILGVNPNEAENIGDVYKSQSGKIITVGVSSWTINSDLAPYAAIEDQILDLLDKFKNNEVNFLTISKLHPPDLNIVAHVKGDETPYIGWSSEVMKMLGKFNFSWGIDLSVYTEEI